VVLLVIQIYIFGCSVLNFETYRISTDLCLIIDTNNCKTYLHVAIEARQRGQSYLRLTVCRYKAR
jgi:hypothetical protein